MTSNDFADRVVVVTGAASGIGAATAAAFVASGAFVVMIDLDGHMLAKHAAELGSDRTHALALDITQLDNMKTALSEVVKQHGAVHHLVNCAGSFIAAGLDASFEQWRRVLDVNVAASAMLTAAVSQHMPSGGTVVNVASISAHAAQPNRWTYNATKAAILALTRGQAMDLGVKGIRVNSVSPGWIWTPEVQKAAEGDRERWEPIWGKYHMLRRLGEPPEVADAILYLSSDRASFITATELMVDGGYSAMGPEGLGDDAKFAGSEV